MTAIVDEYIDNLPEDRRIAIRAVREAVNAKLPPGYEEGIVYGLISWFVPFTRLAETYNGQPLCVASLGAQKSHMALYLQSVYGDPALNEWFQKAWKATGKKLDMGKSCVRFKKLDDLALDVISEAISRVSVDQYVAQYEAARANTAEGKKSAAKAAVATIEAKAKDVVGKAEAKAKDVVGKAEAKAKDVVGKAEAKAKQTAAKAKQAASAKTHAASAKTKAAAATATAKTKAAATNATGKAKAARANATGKAKAAITKVESKAKAAAAKAGAKAKQLAGTAKARLQAVAARAKSSAKKSSARA